ncbi:sensor histidine kinase [Gemmatimonas phototrophica]|uniref:histidine kinase n=1 Tax=Gemmatimonas phototrophica TaxID=1379270 RepID=A0A143BHT1_9BACT|nr:HAMP domain-containing sensor histidine kinase [Gemmatimonas phototrophica]AMW04163.1 hypothetical protein GEMMAAP_03585 [Gemmatimonas phototrophica]
MTGVPDEVLHQADGFTAEPVGAKNIDVSPEAIAALVAQGAQALNDSAPLPSAALPDALRLLVGITHDLRSPLSSMLMLIERLRTGQAGPVTPQQEKQLGLLYSAAFGVASLTNDALDVARGTAHDVGSASPMPFSIAEVWKTVRALVHPIAEEKQLLLRWSGPAADRRIGHPGALHRVLLNLVTNALKFTTTGSVTVTAEELGDHLVRFVVADTGMGLPASVQAQLRRNGQLSNDPLVSSAGLGIAMCQQMLAVMDSELRDLSIAGRPGAALGFDVRLAPRP